MHPLKKIRVERLNWSVKELASVIGCSVQTIHFIEAGHQRIGAKVLRALHQMGFDVNQVLTEEEKWFRAKCERLLAKAQ